MTVHITLTPEGHLELPPELRRHLGLPDGGLVFLEETDDGLVLRAAEQAVARAQAIVREHTRDDFESSVDGFLAQRRASWGE